MTKEKPPCITCVVQASCQAKIQARFAGIVELLRICPYVAEYIANKRNGYMNQIRVSKISRIFGYKVKRQKGALRLERSNHKGLYLWIQNDNFHYDQNIYKEKK